MGPNEAPKCNLRLHWCKIISAWLSFYERHSTALANELTPDLGYRSLIQELIFNHPVSSSFGANLWDAQNLPNENKI